MNEDDPLREALDELRHLANVLYDAIEDESLNETINLTKGNYDD
jgi:hypothetical protein